MSDRFKQGEEKQIEQDHVDALRENKLRDRLSGALRAYDRWRLRTYVVLVALLALTAVNGIVCARAERAEMLRDEWQDIARSAIDNFYKLDAITGRLKKERDIMILLWHSTVEKRQYYYAKDLDPAYAAKSFARSADYEAKALEAVRDLCGTTGGFMILEDSVRCEVVAQ